MARPTTLQAYRRSPLPLIEGGDLRYYQAELAEIETAFAELVLMVPQPAIVAPKVVRDGMQRLARSPWRPIGGSVDAWVFWDAPSGTWKAL